jgi:hypothetical protein
MIVYRDIRSKLPWHPKKRWVKREFPGKVKNIVVHTTASSNQDPFITNDYHITPAETNHICKSGAPRLCYHDFVSLYDGKIVVQRCNEYTDSTWHAGLLNKRSIGVVLAYRGQDDAPAPAELLYVAYEHVARLCLLTGLTPDCVVGHREVPWLLRRLGMGSKQYYTICPGKHLNCDEMRSSITMIYETIMHNTPTFSYIGTGGALFGDVGWVLV